MWIRWLHSLILYDSEGLGDFTDVVNFDKFLDEVAFGVG
jgi:hypothetical protein